MDYFVASVSATSRVATMAVVGSLAARSGVLDPKMRKGLSKLCKDFFLPALLVAGVPPHLTAATVAHLWLLPLAAAFYVGVGLLFGRLACFGFGIAADARDMVTAACALPTTTGPILAVLAAVISASPVIGDAAAREAALGQGTAAVLVYTASQGRGRARAGRGERGCASERSEE